MKKILAAATAALIAMSTMAQAAQISYDDGTLNITSDESIRADLIQAVYDDEGRLIEADAKSVSAPYNKEFEPAIGKLNKLMFWNSAEGMEPLAEEPEEVFIESVVREGITECYPYQFNETTPYQRKLNEKFTMSGEQYTDGFVMHSYTGAAQALFNLDNEYKEVSFVVGHIDGTRDRDNTLNVYLDRKLVEMIPLSSADAPQTVTINTEGVSGLRLEIAGMYDAQFGFADFKYVYTGENIKNNRNNWMNVFAPYQYNEATPYQKKLNEKFTMSGDEYTDGFVMHSYTGAAEVQFNLEGKCEELTFTAGHIDNTSNRNLTLNVYLDRVLMHSIPLYYDEVAKTHTISLKNADGELAQHMKFSVSGMYDAEYGFANGYFKYTDKPQQQVADSNWMKVFTPYQYNEATPYQRKLNEKFTMSGYEWTDGFVMHSYTGAAEVQFNLEGKCEELTFTVGHIDNTSNRNNTLEVYLDRVKMYEIPLHYDDVAREHTISLENVDGKLAQHMKFSISGMYDAEYGFTYGYFDYAKEPAQQVSDSNWMEVFSPYQYNETTEYRSEKEQKFTMSGYEWTDGFVMHSYTGTAETQFNLAGNCEELTFTVGHIDNTSNRNNTLNVYLDRVLMYEIPLYYDDVAREHTISLENVDGDLAKHMRFAISGMYDAQYGFTGGYFDYVTADYDVKATSTWLDQCAPLGYNNIKLYTEEEDTYFTMSGDKYTDGFVMSNYIANSNAEFLTDGKYSALKVAIGHIDNTSNRNLGLSVYLDDVLMETIDMNYDDVAREHTISLKNVDGKNASRIKLSVGAMYDAQYGIAGGEFIK